MLKGLELHLGIQQLACLLHLAFLLLQLCWGFLQVLGVGRGRGELSSAILLETSDQVSGSLLGEDVIVSLSSTDVHEAGKEVRESTELRVSMP